MSRFQHVAMALQGVLSDLLNRNRPVHTVHKTLAYEPITVVFSRLVETPVLEVCRMLRSRRASPQDPTLAVLSEATSSTKSGGLPCSDMTYPLLR